MPIKEVALQLGKATAIPFEETAAKNNETLSTQANVPQQEQTLADESNKASWDRIGKSAEAFNKYHMSLGVEDGVPIIETCAAILLENFNMREFFPTDLGGINAYDEISCTVTDWYSNEYSVSTESGVYQDTMQPLNFDNISWTRICKLTEDFNKFHKLYGSDYSLSETDLAAGLLLENENIRRHYPKDLGGPQGHMNLAYTVLRWFEENKNKTD